MALKADQEYEQKLEFYEKLLATHPKIDRKGKNTPYTSLNGHMFSFLGKENKVGLRLPKEEREKFIQKYSTNLCVQYGKVMKEYVEVPFEVLKKTAELKNYLASSYNYVSSLKAKPTKKKK